MFATLLVCGVSEATPNWEKQPDCSLLSERKVISDGYQQTPVRLRIDDSQLTVITDSNIDNSKPARLLVDGRDLAVTSQVENDTNLAFNDNIRQIVDRIIVGKHAEVRLYFWPTWPDTGEKTVRFSLIGFTRAYRSEDECT